MYNLFLDISKKEQSVFSYLLFLYFACGFLSANELELKPGYQVIEVPNESSFTLVRKLPCLIKGCQNQLNNQEHRGEFPSFIEGKTIATDEGKLTVLRTKLEPTFSGVHLIKMPYFTLNGKEYGGEELIIKVLPLKEESDAKHLPKSLLGLDPSENRLLDDQNTPSNGVWDIFGDQEKSQRFLSTREILKRWLLLAICFFGLCYLFYKYLWKHVLRLFRKNIKTLTPFEKAQMRLKEIRKALIENILLPEPFYVGLIEILREFFEGQCLLQAREQTTEEFMENLREYDRFNQEQKDLLTLFLKEADLIKFARGKTSREQCLSTFDGAQNFVKSFEEKRG